MHAQINEMLTHILRWLLINFLHTLTVLNLLNYFEFLLMLFGVITSLWLRRFFIFISFILLYFNGITDDCAWTKLTLQTNLPLEGFDQAFRVAQPNAYPWTLVSWLLKQIFWLRLIPKCYKKTSLLVLIDANSWIFYYSP